MKPYMHSQLSNENESKVRCVDRGKIAISKNEAQIVLQIIPKALLGKTMEGLTPVCGELKRG